MSTPQHDATRAEAMHLIHAAVKSHDTDQVLQAGDLLKRMGAAFATHNS